MPALSLCTGRKRHLEVGNIKSGLINLTLPDPGQQARGSSATVALPFLPIEDVQLLSFGSSSDLESSLQSSSGPRQGRELQKLGSPRHKGSTQNTAKGRHSGTAGRDHWSLSLTTVPGKAI